MNPNNPEGANDAPPPFEPENDFERSLVRATGDPTHRPQFYRDFVAAAIFIIQEAPIPEQKTRVLLEPGMTLRIVSMDIGGVPYIPIFSSITRMKAAIDKDRTYLELNAKAFMMIATNMNLVLNPGSQFGKHFTAEEIGSILDGSIWQQGESYEAGEAVDVMIGQPATHPTELADALARYFKTKKAVKRAYLAHFFNPQRDTKPHTLVGIETDGDWNDIVAGIGSAIGDVAVPDPPVDFIRITGNGGVEDYFLNECKPFYQKKLFGLL